MISSLIKVNQRYARIVWIVLLLLCFGTGTLQAKPIKLRSFSKIGGDFTLIDMNGKLVQLSDFNKKVVILYFGYTFCPDICPNTLFVMADVLKQLGDTAQKLQILYITLDPERDTEKRLRDYLDIFDDRIMGLRGDKNATLKIAKKYVIRYRKKFLGSDGAYVINHSSYAFLIDKKGIIRYLYPYKTTPRFIVETVNKLLAEPS
jgi:protein SCO1